MKSLSELSPLQPRIGLRKPMQPFKGHAHHSLVLAEIIQALKETILLRIVKQNITGNIKDYDPNIPKDITSLYRPIKGVNIVTKAFCP